MSNLLNELSVTMKEVSKAKALVTELEDKERDLSEKVLSNEKAKKALSDKGVIVGNVIIKYYEYEGFFTYESMPIFAHDINFDEPENESKNPFKVGDWVIMFNDETIASKVSYVEGDEIETENEMWSGHYKCFTKVAYNEHEIESENPFKVGDEVYYPSGLNKSKKVVSHVVGNSIKIDGNKTTYHHSFFSFS